MTGKRDGWQVGGLVRGQDHTNAITGESESGIAAHRNAAIVVHTSQLSRRQSRIARHFLLSRTALSQNPHTASSSATDVHQDFRRWFELDQ
jgi:hypothetical protein